MSTGKRYTKEEKAEILEFRKTNTATDTMKKFNISLMTLARWNQQDRMEYRRELTQKAFDQASLPPQPKEELQNLLRVIKFLDGVTGVLVIDDEGIVRASVTDPQFKENPVIGCVVAMLAAHDRVGSQLEFGKPEVMVSQYNDGLLLILGVGKHLVLTVLYDGTSALETVIAEDLKIITKVVAEIH